MRARLLNPVTLTIEPIDRANTRRDPDREDPRLHVRRLASVEVLAQVDPATNNRRRETELGGQIDAVADLTFLRRNLVDAGYAPTDGDRITTITDRTGATRSVAWYIVQAHRDGQEYAGDKLVVATASTKAPSRVTVEGV